MVASIKGSARRLRVVSIIAVAFGGASLAHAAAADAASSEGIHTIKHVVMIMQENRSFDSYFGTYPGANGIPPGVCVPDPLHRVCVKPFHDPSDKNFGGPHGSKSMKEDVDHGKMDGFVEQEEKAMKCSSINPNCSECSEPAPAEEQGKCVDATGYHDAREIPNYWTYAKDFVLQDDMFESVASWSLPEHLYLVSAWSAVCPRQDLNPFLCVGSLNPDKPARSLGARSNRAGLHTPGPT